MIIFFVVAVNTIVNMTFRLLNFSITPGLRDKNSAEFQALASEFCQYVSKDKQAVDLKLPNILFNESFDELHEAVFYNVVFSYLWHFFLSSDNTLKIFSA